MQTAIMHHATKETTMAKNTGKLYLCALVNGVPVPMVKESLAWSNTKDLAWNNTTAGAEKWLKANRATVRDALKPYKGDGACFAKFYIDERGNFEECEVFELTPAQLLQRDWEHTFNTFKGSLGESVAKTIADTTHAAMMAKLAWVHPMFRKKDEATTAQDTPPIPQG